MASKNVNFWEKKRKSLDFQQIYGRNYVNCEKNSVAFQIFKKMKEKSKNTINHQPNLLFRFTA